MRSRTPSCLLLKLANYFAIIAVRFAYAMHFGLFMSAINDSRVRRLVARVPQITLLCDFMTVDDQTNGT